MLLKVLSSVAAIATLLAFDTQLARAGQSAASALDDADRLYANREDLGSAERAATLWEERLVIDPRDFEAAWKLSRAYYWLGGHVAEDERRESTSRGSPSHAGRTSWSPTARKATSG